MDSCGCVRGGTTENLGKPALKEKPLVSVCIANYNGAGFIAGCIDSVLAQRGEFSVEILVHDDASLDGSAEIVSRDYPAVRLIRSEHNVGFCISNNRMVAEAQGRYVLLLNNDAELLPDALMMLIEEAQAIDHPAILSLPQYDYASGNLIDRGCLLDPFFNPVPNLDPGRQDVAMVIGACLWLPRAIWQEIGGFPGWFGSIAEDMHLCCRARLAGHPVRALGVSGYRHRVGQSFGGGALRGGRLESTLRRRQLSERNKTFVMAMTVPAPWVQIILPIHLVLLIVEGCLFSLVKRDTKYLREIYFPVLVELLHKRSLLIKERQRIMSLRNASIFNYLSVFCVFPYKLKMLVRHGFPRVN